MTVCLPSSLPRRLSRLVLAASLTLLLTACYDGHKSGTDKVPEPTPEPTPTEPVVTPTEPVVTPTEPVVTPTEPVVTPTEPVVTPTEPVVTPTEPVVTPTEPVVTPTEPVVTPTEPVVTPTEPVVTPTEPVVTPTEPVVTPTEPVVTPTEPVVTPTEPVVTPTEPVVAPTEPVVTPTEPVVTPTEPVVAPTEPVVTPTEPVVTPTEPVVTPTEPVVTPTEPVVTPTEPVVTPTEPVVTPTEPVVTPTEPVVTPTEPVVTPTEPVVTPTEPVVTPIEPVVTPTEPVVTPTEPVVTPTDPDACVPNPMGDTSLYLRGGMNSWATSDSYKFTYICNHFELVTNISGTYSFKIADSSWSSNANFGDNTNAAIVLDSPMLLTTDGSNLDFTFTGANKVVVDMRESATTPTLSISTSTEPVVTPTEPVVTPADPGVCVPNPMGDTTLYLRGGMNSWATSDSYKFTYICNHFELVTKISGANSFKIADASWSTNANFGGNTSSLVTADTPVVLKSDGLNLDFTFTGVNKVVVDMRQSTTTPTLTIYSCPASPFGETPIYLKGEMNGWTGSNKYRFTYSCDAYYLNVNETGQYSFKLADGYWSLATTFGGITDGVTLAYGEVTPIISNTNEPNNDAKNLSFNFTGANTAKLGFNSDGSNPTLTIGDQTFTSPDDFPVTDATALSVAFDSRNSNFKSPFGAVTEGSTINYSLTALPGVSDMALVVASHKLEGNQDVLENTELARVALTKSTEGGLERWSGSYTFPSKGVYSYYFQFKVGNETYVYENNSDTVYWTTEKGTDGVGTVAFLPGKEADIRRYRQSVYLSSFQVPDWAQDAVYYQIFADRFRNGDTSNDPAPGKDTYLEQPVELHSNWNDKPSVPGDGSDSNWNNDFFGGDLQGIIDELDYLADLGINTLYINPIFEAGSNHKYDTGDYMKVDDNFGDNALFATLNAAAKAKGIRVVLDTSLNHTGSDSVYFDRYGRYTAEGAFEGETINSVSPYASWYKFYSDATTTDKMYAGWLGNATLPELVESDSYKAFAYGNDDSVTKYWLDQGLSGWRMDVAPWVSDEFWRGWRPAVKSKDPDAVTVAETWFDASKFLLGDEFDSTMNYIFRNAVLDFAAGKNASQIYRNMEMMREHYPQQALFALMNLFSSHDVERALYILGYQGASTDASAVVTAKQRFMLATLFQMSYPGAPSIYYGDEVGVTGGADPFNRSSYPWADKGGSPDTDMHTKMKALIKMRKDYPVLRRGSLSAPLYSDSHVVVLLREFNAQKALVMLNNDTSASTLNLTLPAGLAGSYQDVLTSNGFTVADDGTLSLTVPALYGRVLISQ